MPLIECISGPVETEVGGETYSFQRDEHGRCVCNVPNLRHAECLLSVAAHYRRADDDAPGTAGVEDGLQEITREESLAKPDAPGAAQTGETQPTVAKTLAPKPKKKPGAAQTGEK